VVVKFGGTMITPFGLFSVASSFLCFRHSRNCNWIIHYVFPVVLSIDVFCLDLGC
jgi:hypothetical protein